MLQSGVYAPGGSGSSRHVATRCKEADEVAAGVLELIPVLRAYALSLTRNMANADDLVQDTLVKMLRYREQYQPGTNLRAWAFTILRHCHINVSRQRANRTTEELHEWSCEVEGSQPWHMENLDLQAALDELPTKQREVVVMVGALGLSYDEVAMACGCAVGTVKSRLSRARDQLARRLGYESGWRSPAS